MKKETDHRGFINGKFKDVDGVECWIKESCLGPYIRLGAIDIGLKHFVANRGWEDVDTTFKMDEHYVANTSMLLSQKIVKQ
jgi:hypothetical protein